MSLLNKESSTVCLLFLLIYLVCAAGYVDTRDADPSIETAYALVEYGQFNLHPANFEAKYYFQNGHRMYSKMGWVMPMIYAPLVAIAKWTSRYSSHPERDLSDFMISLVNSFLTAAIICTLFVFLRRHGLPFDVTWLCVTAAGLCTYLFAYAKSAHREPMQAFCIFLCYTLLSFSKPNRKDTTLYFFASSAAILGCLTKQALIVPLLPALILGLIRAKCSSNPGPNLSAFIFPIVIGSLIYAFCSRWIFGTWFSTGYHSNTLFFRQGSWPNALMDGIWEQLFSIKSGYFFFNPIVILGMPLVIWMIHKRLFSFFDGCVVSSFIIQVLFYAKWEYPLGGPGIGPRYLVVTTPLLFLLIRPATWRFFRITPIKYLSLALVFVSLFIQIANVSVKPQTYWTLQARALEELSTPHWLANVKFFEHKITRGNELYKIAEFGAKNSRSISLADAPTLVGFNYWWLHVWRQSHREPMV